MSNAPSEDPAVYLWQRIASIAAEEGNAPLKRVAEQALAEVQEQKENSNVRLSNGAS
jgi:hypothetical protein